MKPWKYLWHDFGLLVTDYTYTANVTSEKKDADVRVTILEQDNSLNGKRPKFFHSKYSTMSEIFSSFKLPKRKTTSQRNRFENLQKMNVLLPSKSLGLILYPYKNSKGFDTRIRLLIGYHCSQRMKTYRYDYLLYCNKIGVKNDL